ncbi:DUF1877 family protein [Chitinophaga rhizophila]|uniref:YfbM family protein n=1 Tax=Chitinophaga rhizophila TaxID=2866212 RepID=A0ABS7G7P8_9BACT|nr:DUF1877 family protein [Chitinophaga rhizophila]MBW8683325.1 YfbM family protein [Chitinophaga rhizophila]
MSQSITLYRISPQHFEMLKADPEGTGILNISKEHIVFPQTFEAIRFILSKEQDEETESLIKQIFYPEAYIERKVDIAGMEMLSDDLDLDDTAIYYNHVDDVADMDAFLQTISVEQFHKRYDPQELNKNNIYPSKVWTEEGAPDRAFTRSHLAGEFADLKSFMAAAKLDGDYVLSYVW